MRFQCFELLKQYYAERGQPYPPRLAAREAEDDFLSPFLTEQSHFEDATTAKLENMAPATLNSVKAPKAEDLEDVSGKRKRRAANFHWTDVKQERADVKAVLRDVKTDVNRAHNRVEEPPRKRWSSRSVDERALAQKSVEKSVESNEK